MLITSYKVKIEPDKQTVELRCKWRHSFTVAVQFSNNYKTVDVFEKTLLKDPTPITRELLERFRDYFIKQAKKKIGIKLLQNFMHQNPRGYCITKKT